MNRAERRSHSERIKAKFRRIAKAYEMPAHDPRWLGRVAAMHFTCPCGMCTTELKHSRPDDKRGRDHHLLTAS